MSLRVHARVCIDVRAPKWTCVSVRVCTDVCVSLSCTSVHGGCGCLCPCAHVCAPCTCVHECVQLDTCACMSVHTCPCPCVHVGMRECRGVCARITCRAACPVCVHTHKCAQECLCPCARVWRGEGAPVVMCTPLCVCTPVQGWLCARALHARVFVCVHARVRARVCGHAELPAAGGAARGGWRGMDPHPVGPAAVPLLLGTAVPHGRASAGCGWRRRPFCQPSSSSCAFCKEIACGFCSTGKSDAVWAAPRHAGHDSLMAQDMPGTGSPLPHHLKSSCSAP